MSKILRHPMKDIIIEDLTSGKSVRVLEAEIKEKYPKYPKLWITSVTLQAFRKNYLKLDGQVLKDLQETGRIQKQQIEEQEKQKQIQGTEAYQRKLHEIVDTKLDVSRKILELDKIIEGRIEHWYNAIANGTETARSGDKEIRLYMDRMFVLLGQYKKFVEGMADKTIDHNVNITVMNDQISLIRDVIRECIGEMDPDQAMKFLEKLGKRMGELSYRPMAELSAPKLTLKELGNIPEAEIELIGLPTEPENNVK